MESKVNYAIVGIFVLVLGTALVWGVLWLSGGKSYRKSYDVYQIYMSESVSGLSLDAPVSYRGVEVGRVRKIALAQQNMEQVELTLDIERGTPVKQDTVAVLRVQGLTGIAHVELSGGSRDSPALQAQPGEDYPVIRARPSLMVRLDSAVTALLGNLNHTSEGLNALLDEENRRAFKRTLADLETLSRTLAARSAAIDASLANAARVSAELPQLVERIQRGADGFDQLMRAGNRAAGTLEGAAGDARQFAGNTLPEAHTLITELRELTGSLRRFSDQLERDPGVLLRGKPAAKLGPGE